MNTLTGKNVILTGASHGIGPYIARALNAGGAKLVLAARSTDALESLAESLSGPGSATAIATDINDPAQRLNLVKRTRNNLGEINILINNAGIEEIVPFDHQDPEMIPAIINTNVIAPMLLAREVLPEMLERGSGKIVNVASLAGRAGLPFGAVYSGSKAALAEWSISLHAEVRDRGVQVSAVCPGFVSTAGMHARKKTPAPRTLGEVTPEAVARAVLRAIDTGRAEILVSARPMRPLLALKALAPGAALAFARKTGMINYLKSLAASSGKGITPE